MAKNEDLLTSLRNQINHYRNARSEHEAKKANNEAKIAKLKSAKDALNKVENNLYECKRAWDSIGYELQDDTVWIGSAKEEIIACVFEGASGDISTYTSNISSLISSINSKINELERENSDLRFNISYIGQIISNLQNEINNNS